MESEQKNKRQWLTEIVSFLGPDATPAQIKEEAYRVGFGSVNGHMLMAVRDTLWPSRKRHGGGFRRDEREAKAVGEALLHELVPCPKCGSARIWAKGKYQHKDGSGMVTRKRVCRDCGHDWRRHELDKPLSKKQSTGIQWALRTEQKCTYCKQILPLESFSLRAGSDIIRRPGCKECINESRAKASLRDSMKKHGLTVEQYESMLQAQCGCCAICGTNDPFGSSSSKERKRKIRVFSIDHCHATDAVRGLLCARCNLAIGNFDDDIGLLQAAIRYIEKHRQSNVESATIPQSE